MTGGNDFHLYLREYLNFGNKLCNLLQKWEA